jgi:hypothetical protein
MLASLCQLQLLHNHRMQSHAMPTEQSCWGKPRFVRPAWLPLVLALLCLSLGPVRSCLMQEGEVGGGSRGGALTAHYLLL